MSAEHLVSFLTAGPAFTLTVPSEFRLPEVNSPVDFGSGFGRSVFYLPYEGFEQFPADRFRHVTDIEGVSGRVLVFERFGDPLYPLNWFLMWPLEQGSLVSFMKGSEVERGNDEVGVSHARVAAENLEIKQYGGSAPVTVLHPPLVAKASRLPGWAEYITFTNSEGSRSLELTRPGRLRAGRKQRELNSHGAAVRYRAGTARGVDVEIQGDFDTAEADELLEHSSRVLST